MPTRVEYAIADSLTGEIQMRLDQDRERAFRIVEQFNRRHVAGEPDADHFTVVTRTIIYGDWEPALAHATARGGITG